MQIGLVGMCFWLGLPLVAQSLHKDSLPTCRVGLELGAEFSTLTGSGIYALQLPGFSAALLAEKPFTNRWEGAGGLGFAMRGFAKYPNPEDGDFDRLEARFNYLELRLGLRYRLLQNRKLSLEAFLMPAVLLGQSVRDAFGDVQNVQEGQAFDLGLAFGLDYAITERWVLTARFRHSLIPVITNVDGNLQFNPVFGQVNLGQFNASLFAGIRYRWAKAKV